jgi:hypothetical protein
VGVHTRMLTLVLTVNKTTIITNTWEVIAIVAKQRLVNIGKGLIIMENHIMEYQGRKDLQWALI